MTGPYDLASSAAETPANPTASHGSPNTDAPTTPHGSPNAAAPAASHGSPNTAAPSASHNPAVVSVPAHPHGRCTDSLKRTVSTTLIVFSLAVVLAFAALASQLLYQSYERSAENRLTANAEATAQSIADKSQLDAIAQLQSQVVSQLRYTYIASDGTVLFDSEAGTNLENHADRPEVQQAQESGEALISRYSMTLKTDQVYVAVRLDDSSTIRLSEERASFVSFLGGVAVPLSALIVIVIVLDLMVSRLLTDRIMRPLNAIDVDDPLSNDIYEEVSPLLTRIDDQRQRMKQQNEALAEAENMRREFSANVSHEMKTPLTVISGYAEMLKNDMVKPQDQQRFAGLIYDEAQEMRTLIDDVLTISKLEEPSRADDQLETVDLHAVAQTAAGRLGELAREANVAIRVEGEPVLVLGSRTLCEQMLYNLASNAIRYNKDGGSVVLATSLDESGRAVASVADTGMGIPPELHDKIFERFYRIESSRSKTTGGTGLGLAIVKHAVQRQGGAIEIFSHEGEGTTFTLTFPLVEERRKALERRRAQ